MPAEQETDLRQQFEERPIDIKMYIDILFRRRRLVVSLALLLALFAALLNLISPPPYTAVAQIAMIKAKPDIVFDPNFRTVSEEDLAAVGGLNNNSRRTAFVGLVENAAIAQKVVETLGDKLPESKRRAAKLLEDVEGQVEQNSDLISIAVSDSDPNVAAMIANAWATEYEKNINLLYTGAPLEYSSSVDTELTRAKEIHEQAQGSLETFIKDNQLDELTRSIADKQAILDLLQKGRQSAVQAVIDEQISAQTQLINAYYSAQAANQLLAFNKQQEAKRTMLSSYIDAEIQNRLMAFSRDREIRNKLFSTYVNAEINGKMAVINEQIRGKNDNTLNLLRTENPTSQTT